MSMKRLLIATSVVAIATAGVAFAQNATTNAPSATTSPTKTGGPDTGGRYQTGTGDAGNLSSGPQKTPEARSMSPTNGGMSSTTNSLGPNARNNAISMKTVRQAQTALTQDGFYKGKIDGKFGAQTRVAVSQFQAQNGLSQTAKLDAPTMKKLASGSAAAAGMGSATSNTSGAVAVPLTKTDTPAGAADKAMPK